MDAEILSEPETRVLLAVPTARDREITCSLFKAEGLICSVCDSLGQLSRETKIAAGAILLTEEVFTADGIDEFLAALEDQPAWSDIPVVMLMQGCQGSPAGARVLGALRNVTLLERPAPMRSVISAVQAAVRARRRQYQIRDLLEAEQAARAESERASRIKDEFLATLSHELRTPLNAILGWSQLLRQGAGDKEILEEGLAVIDRNTRVQVQLIEDLLDMSRIISGKIRLNVQFTDVSTFIDAAIETVKPSADAKGIRLEKVLDRRGGSVSGDPGRLQQVVWNLLSNAIKFTPRGGTVQVLTRRVNSSLEISVSDTGRGIPPEFLPYVFERFRQADSSTTRAHGGLGLGLSIVKHLVELHGGTVRADSPGENQGSTFTVVLSLAAVHLPAGDQQRLDPTASSAEPLDCRSTSLGGIKILVVDDESDARRLVKRVLEECDAQVITASSAAEALQLVVSESPDVLVSDIGMPVMDGYELIRRVRALNNGKNGRIPAIALTAFARSQDRTRALLAGYLVHISKPIEPHELIATVATVAGRTGNGDKRTSGEQH